MTASFAVTVTPASDDAAAADSEWEPMADSEADALGATMNTGMALELTSIEAELEAAT